MTETQRLVIRFDKLLTELHLRTEDATVCGEDLSDGTPWIAWTDDGTPHCAACFGEALREEGLFE